MSPSYEPVYLAETYARENWFALVVKPRHEKAVARILEHKGHQAFLPLHRRSHQYGHRLRAFDLPLFPGYVFCRFDPLKRQTVVTTPGVIQIVGAGRVPTPIEEREMNSLQTAVHAQVSAEPWPYLELGQKVWIREGALAGVEGILIHVKQAPRLVISISLLQRSVLLEIDRAMVSSAEPVVM